MSPPRHLRPTSSSMTTSIVFSPPSSSPRRFKPATRTLFKLPSCPPSFLSFRRACIGLSRPCILLISTISTLLFFFLNLPPSTSLPDDGLSRFALAGAHFRANLSSEGLRQYWREQAAVIAAASPLMPPDSREFVVVDNPHNAFFQKCMISDEHSTLHPSLRRGPDEKEIADRKNAKQPRDFDDTFATIDRKRYFFHPDRPAVRTVDALAAGLDTDLQDAISVSKAVVERDSLGLMDVPDVPIVYVRTTRQDGMQIIVNIGGTVNKTVDGVTNTLKVRRIVTVSKGFGKSCEAIFVRPKEVVRIHILLAYSERPHRLEGFLKMFAGYFRTFKTDLVKIVVSTTEKEKVNVEKVAETFPELTSPRFAIVTSKGDEYGNFSRAVAMREAAKTVPKDEVMFFSDADLIIGGNFLQNCRVNIVRGFQVWFPVMFSLYPYGHSLSSHDGLWRRSSYGMACMYRSDFDAVGGFGGKEETAFTGWGSEDVFLYNSFRDNEKYAVLRTLEPGLQHQWHGKECERNENYENCMRTVYMTIGSQDVIAKLMSEKRVDISSLTSSAVPV